MSGFVAIDKACGLSSSDVVIKCRNAYSKAFGLKIKCGHMGTLDPAASGVLLLGFGKATRLFDIMQNKIKTYVAEIKFGEETDTLDREGSIINTSSLPHNDLIIDTISSFKGKISQIPPKYSAISINGKRSYDLARSGIDFQLEARKVTIYDIKLLDSIIKDDLCQSIKIQVSCSSGTYIRSLVRDIAYKMNVVGYMTSLDRISIGLFDKSNCISMQEFISNPKEYVIPTIEVLKQFMPIFEVTEEYRKKVINGVTVNLNANLPEICALTIDNKIFGIGKTINNETKSIINLWEE